MEERALPRRVTRGPSFNAHVRALAEPRMPVVHIGMILVGVALAHLPHDDVNVVVVPPGLDDAAPWLLATHPYSGELLARSDDGARTWTLVGGDPTTDHALAGGWWSTWMALVAEDRVWWSEDGEAWADVPNPATAVDAAFGDDAWLATSDGLYRIRPDGPPVRALSGDIAHVSADGGSVAAIDAAGEIWVLVDGAWEARPGVVATAVSADGSWAGDAAGMVQRWADGWVACGALGLSGADPAVVHLVAADGAPVALTGAGGPYLGDPTCANWTPRVAMVPDYQAAGGPESAEDAFATFQVVGERWLVAGHDGIYLSEDAGLTWRQSQWFPADVTRGFAFPNLAPNWVMRGAYGTAVDVTRSAGEAWMTPGLGPVTIAAQTLGVPVGGDSRGEAWALVNHQPWWTDDAGQHWHRMRPAYDTTGEVFALYNLDHVWVFPQAPIDEADPAVLESRDRGLTWASIDVVEAEREGGHAIGAFLAPGPNGSELCVGVSQPARLFCSPEYQDDWRAIYVGEGALLQAYAWPLDAPTMLVLQTDAAVLTSEDFGDAWVSHDLTLPVDALAQGSDGTLTGAAPDARLYRSDDGGLTWSDLDQRLQAPVYVLSARPTTDEVLVGTHDGAFVLTDGQLSRFGALQRIDDGSGFATCVGCASRPMVGAVLGTVTDLPQGATFDFSIRGHDLLLYGVTDGRGLVEVIVDDETVGTIVGQPDLGPDSLFRLDGLAEGWHRVRLQGVEAGISIDYAQSRGEDVALEVVDVPASVREGCGCAGVAAPGWAALAALPVAFLRRARAHRAAIRPPVAT